MTRLLLAVLASIYLSTAFASYCGKSGVPYSFEVLESGAPVLGCAQPSCIISSDDFEEDSEFLTDVNNQADGYFREGDRALKRYRHDSAPKLVANCSGGFSQLSCPRKNQWVGGIEYIDHPRQPLILQCCSFDGLRFSQEVGMTVVNSGEAVTGGEVIRNGRQISFDVIANVRKIVQPGHGHKPSYEVTVRRMNCLPDPPEPEVDYDKDVPSEILKVLSTAKNGKDLGTKEKFEKMSEKKQEQKKKKSKKTEEPAQFAAKQYAAETQKTISVDGSSNIEPLPTASPQVPASQKQPQPLPQQPQPVPQAPQVQTNTPAPFQPPQQPQQPQPYPGFGAPGGFPGFPAPAPGFGGFPGLPTFAPFGVTPAPFGAGFGTTTSTWDAAIASQPPRPTYPSGETVFPTIGTGFMTPMPLHHTFPSLGGAPAFPGVVTPVPPVAGRSGSPDQTNLPDLARPPPLPRLEQQVAQQGSAAAISSVDGGSSVPATGAQAHAAPTAASGGLPAAPAFPAPLFPHHPLPTFPPHPPLAGFQPFTFPPHPHHAFPALPGFPAPAAASGSAVTPPTLPAMPTFSFPAAPFTFPPHQQVAGGQSQPATSINSAPAPPPSAASATGVKAQGAVLFPVQGAGIQFPGLTPLGTPQA